MVSNRVLRCHRPKVNHIGIVTVHDNPSLGEIVCEKQFRLVGRSVLRRPCGFSAARKTVNKHDAEVSDQISGVWSRSGSSLSRSLR